jgi:hypothetical protein
VYLTRVLALIVSDPHPQRTSLLFLFTWRACKLCSTTHKLEARRTCNTFNELLTLSDARVDLKFVVLTSQLFSILKTIAHTNHLQIFSQLQQTQPDKMARGAVATQLSSLASNPYPRPKVQQPYVTTCELCDRSIQTKDWVSHKNSKKHREAEANEKAKTEDTNTNGFNGDAAGFTADTGGFSSGSDAFTTTTSNTDGWGTSGDNAAWGAGDFSINTGTSGYANNNSGGGGGRACFGCGSEGHQKRDCPQGGGGGGGDRACYGCGETGHQKRDCPKAGSGGGQACFNCGEVGYVTS